MPAPTRAADVNPELAFLDTLYAVVTDPTRNNITLGEFRQYEPLYNHERRKGMSQDALQQLSDRWFQRFNLYQKIRIFAKAGDAEPVLELPAWFTKINTLPANAETEAVVRSANSAMASNDPRARAHANDLIRAFLAKQTEGLEDKITAAAEYQAVMARFHAVYGGAPETAAPAAEAPSAPVTGGAWAYD